MMRQRASRLLLLAAKAALAEGRAATRRATNIVLETSSPPLSFWHQTRHQWNDRSGYIHFGDPRQHRRGPSRGTINLLVLCSAGGAVVYIRSRQEVPYTGRVHAVLLSPDSELEMGRQTFAQVLAEASAQGALLPRWHPASQAVRRVGQRVAAVAGDGRGGGFQRHMSPDQTSWEFAVVRSNQVNAFVVPGGKVVVYTGLLRMLESEDELAAVLAHEIAHVLARHAAERITNAGLLEVVRFALYYVFGLPIPSAPLAAAFFLPNSRLQETEADVIGVQLAARACYDPAAAVDVFGKLGRMEERAGAGAMPQFLRTHPVSGDRIEVIKKVGLLQSGLKK
jgi:metalloendopeptidase OMA1, mitochondrial